MTTTDRPSFTCPRCAMTSHHPEDAKHGYCGACHAFTGEPTELDILGIESRARISLRRAAEGSIQQLLAGEDVPALLAEVRRLRETARRAEHMENVMARIPADVLEQAVRETKGATA